MEVGLIIIVCSVMLYLPYNCVYCYVVFVLFVLLLHCFLFSVLLFVFCFIIMLLLEKIFKGLKELKLQYDTLILTTMRGSHLSEIPLVWMKCKWACQGPVLAYCFSYENISFLMKYIVLGSLCILYLFITKCGTGLISTHLISSERVIELV